MDLDPREHSYLLPAPYQEVWVNDPRWNEALLSLRRRPVLSDEPEGRTWHPAPILPRLIETRTPGRAIDLGCGNGRDAVWLASQGWRVTAVDRLSECKQRVFRMAAHYKLQDRIEFIAANAEDIEGQYDLVLAHYTALPVETVQALGGSISILSHSRKHFESFGSPVPSHIKGEEFWSYDRHSVWLQQD